MVGKIIEDCEHDMCMHPLYTGECLKECWKRYKKYYGIEEEAEQKLESMKGE